MTTKIVLKSTDRVNTSTSANECEFNIDWGSILDEGKYRVKYSICKTIKQPPTFNQLLVNKPPWARYDVTGFNVGTQILFDLTGNGRNATCVSCAVSTQISVSNGSGALITSVTGSAGSSSIQFPVGSIPSGNFTICGITRYRGAVATQKRVLVSDQGAYFGHNSAGRGTFNYGGQQLSNIVTTSPVQNYLPFCVSSGVAPPNNVLCDSVSNGLTISAITPFTSRLGINTNGLTNASGFELSQLFIWDQALTYVEMLVMSEKFRQFLASGTL